MDGVEHFTGHALMPPRAALAMPPQRLDRAPEKVGGTPPSSGAVQAARAFVFGFAVTLTCALGLVIYDWFKMNGLWWVEGAIIGLAMFTAFGIALSVATALLGCLPRRRDTARAAEPLDVAVLMPVYGEPIGAVLDNVEAILKDLDREGGIHRYSLTILSDTREAWKVTDEIGQVLDLRARMPRWQIHYRNRDRNRRFKAGNIEDWVTGWGARHDAMLVLDADSVMSARAIRRLADTMSADPTLGLTQSVPRLIGAETIFARTQQFANAIYGATLSRGLALWSGAEANYWGHNALIRVRAFAETAGLPDLPGRRPFGGVILSHDFVEAALLRRAGWGVRFVLDADESYEGTPPTPMGYIMRDRRWCQGNLQHLRLLGSRGFHSVSRVHLLQGAMAYVASVGWFALMILWVAVGSAPGEGIVRYFSEANPLFPAWPEMDLVSRALILLLIYGMLIAPRIIGAAVYWISDPYLRGAGGPVRFWASWLAELAVSIVLAPMMMVQHLIAVTRTLLGRDTGWTPATTSAPGGWALIRFHMLELVLGLALCGLFAVGLLSLWLLPIAVSLVVAPFLSWVFGRRVSRWGRKLFLTPQETLPPLVLQTGAAGTGVAADLPELPTGKAVAVA